MFQDHLPGHPHPVAAPHREKPLAQLLLIGVQGIISHALHRLPQIFLRDNPGGKISPILPGLSRLPAAWKPPALQKLSTPRKLPAARKSPAPRMPPALQESSILPRRVLQVLQAQIHRPAHPQPHLLQPSVLQGNSLKRPPQTSSKHVRPPTDLFHGLTPLSQYMRRGGEYDGECLFQIRENLAIPAPAKYNETTRKRDQGGLSNAGEFFILQPDQTLLRR